MAHEVAYNQKPLAQDYVNMPEETVEHKCRECIGGEHLAKVFLVLILCLKEQFVAV
jgi:hypothetical protein